MAHPGAFAEVTCGPATGLASKEWSLEQRHFSSPRFFSRYTRNLYEYIVSEESGLLNWLGLVTTILDLSAARKKTAAERELYPTSKVSYLLGYQN